MIDVVYANTLRTEEIKRVLSRYGHLLRGKELLEIGSGTGTQLQFLAGVCRSVVGIDLANSIYAACRKGDVVEYDGQTIPFPKESFDVLFSSNVLEHIRNEPGIHHEMHRVLRRKGLAFHVVPTSTWRLWTVLAHYIAGPRNFLRRRREKPIPGVSDIQPQRRNWRNQLLNALIEERHGEFGNRLNEFFMLRASAWRRRFEANGWAVEAVEPLGLAYTGHSLFSNRLEIKTRTSLAKIIGSSAVLVVARPH